MNFKRILKKKNLFRIIFYCFGIIVLIFVIVSIPISLSLLPESKRKKIEKIGIKFDSGYLIIRKGILLEGASYENNMLKANVNYLNIKINFLRFLISDDIKIKKIVAENGTIVIKKNIPFQKKKKNLTHYNFEVNKIYLSNINVLIKSQFLKNIYLRKLYYHKNRYLKGYFTANKNNINVSLNTSINNNILSLSSNLKIKKFHFKTFSLNKADLLLKGNISDLKFFNLSLRGNVEKVSYPVAQITLQKLKISKAKVKFNLDDLINTLFLNSIFSLKKIIFEGKNLTFSNNKVNINIKNKSVEVFYKTPGMALEGNYFIPSKAISLRGRVKIENDIKNFINKNIPLIKNVKLKIAGGIISFKTLKAVKIESIKSIKDMLSEINGSLDANLRLLAFYKKNEYIFKLEKIKMEKRENVIQVKKGNIAYKNSKIFVKNLFYNLDKKSGRVYFHFTGSDIDEIEKNIFPTLPLNVKYVSFDSSVDIHKNKILYTLKHIKMQFLTKNSFFRFSKNNSFLLSIEKINGTNLKSLMAENVFLESNIPIVKIPLIRYKDNIIVADSIIFLTNLPLKKLEKKVLQELKIEKFISTMSYDFKSKSLEISSYEKNNDIKLLIKGNFSNGKCNIFLNEYSKIYLQKNGETLLFSFFIEPTIVKGNILNLINEFIPHIFNHQIKLKTLFVKGSGKYDIVNNRIKTLIASIFHINAIINDAPFDGREIKVNFKEGNLTINGKKVKLVSSYVKNFYIEKNNEKIDKVIIEDMYFRYKDIQKVYLLTPDDWVDLKDFIIKGGISYNNKEIKFSEFKVTNLKFNSKNLPYKNILLSCLINGTSTTSINSQFNLILNNHTNAQGNFSLSLKNKEIGITISANVDKAYIGEFVSNFKVEKFFNGKNKKKKNSYILKEILLKLNIAKTYYNSWQWDKTELKVFYTKENNYFEIKGKGKNFYRGTLTYYASIIEGKYYQEIKAKNVDLETYYRECLKKQSNFSGIVEFKMNSENEKCWGDFKISKFTIKNNEIIEELAKIFTLKLLKNKFKFETISGNFEGNFSTQKYVLKNVYTQNYIIEVKGQGFLDFKKDYSKLNLCIGLSTKVLPEDEIFSIPKSIFNSIVGKIVYITYENNKGKIMIYPNSDLKEIFNKNIWEKGIKTFKEMM